jgi:hypothetical protein
VRKKMTEKNNDLADLIDALEKSDTGSVKTEFGEIYDVAKIDKWDIEKEEIEDGNEDCVDDHMVNGKHRRR